MSDAIIYGLIDPSGEIFYVGQSVRASFRLLDHQRKYGATIDMRVLQDQFIGETVDAAERAWIERLSATGTKLLNIVHNQPKRAVKFKRFTFDVEEDLHRRVKLACVTRGVEIAEVMRELLEREFPDKK